MMLHSIAIGWSITESISLKTVDVKIITPTGKNHIADQPS